MPVLPIQDYAPDMPDIPSNTTDTMFNVLPATPSSYGPMPSFEPYANALSARCQGAISMKTPAGDVRVFAGDESKLYRLTSASMTPADVSKVGGYATSSVGSWSLTTYGQRVISTNGNDAPQGYLDGTDSAFSNLITTGETGLKAAKVCTVREWVVYGRLSGGTFGDRPQGILWGAQDDPTYVPTPGTTDAANALSDFQDFPGDHGIVRGLVGELGSVDLAIFFDRGVRRGIYSGGSEVFAFQPADGVRGLLAEGSLVKFGGQAFYLGEDGFYGFDGATSDPIGYAKVNQTVLADLHNSYIDRMSAAADVKRGLILWAYAGQGSGGELNRLLVYSPVLRRFTHTEAGAVSLEALVRADTFGMTLEGLDAFGTLETLPYSLDSAVWAGGRAALAGFNTSHQFGYFDGAAMAAKISTSDGELVQGRQSLATRLRPLVDTTDATVRLASRNRVQDAVTYGDAKTIEDSGAVRTRNRGRYHRALIEVPSGSTWSHVSGVDVEEFQEMGGR